jgi:hypothetical protein
MKKSALLKVALRMSTTMGNTHSFKAGGDEMMRLFRMSQRLCQNLAPDIF